MKGLYAKILPVLTLGLLFNSPAIAGACTWASYCEGAAAFIARTMDWYTDDGVVMKGHGRNIAVKAADTPNALEYKAKYASMQTHSFNEVFVVEGMNEKGLQCSILYLEGSELPDPSPAKKDVSVVHFLGYVIANFATVEEVLADLPNINLTPPAVKGLPGPGGAELEFDPKKAPLHFALADANGGRAIIELVDAKIKVYHGKEHNALSNEPKYEVQTYLDSAGYQPNGTNLPVDRRGRARQLLADMAERKVDEPQRALLAMRGLIASVYAGTEQIDHIENEVYPTIWSVLADQKKRAYYLERYNTWNTEYYTFSQFAVEKPEVVTLKPAVPPAITLKFSGETPK